MSLLSLSAKAQQLASWIFQSNPKAFDVDGYINAGSATITWLVTRYAGSIAVGDTVYIWRAVGEGKDPSGVIAECRVASSVLSVPPDPSAQKFWKTSTATPASRVRLSVHRIALPKQILKRDWIQADPILQEASIIKAPLGTNFMLSDDQGERLAALWSRTGIDWTWRDSAAGLWAYGKTRGGEISKLPGQPVSDVALSIGRAISGVYNKVMNFRSLDPTDARSGLDGASAVDRKMWAHFFDPIAGAIKESALDEEVARLGLRLGDAAVQSAAPVAQAIAVSGDMGVLLRKYEAAMSGGAYSERPPVRASSTIAFERNPLVVTIALLRASRQCEIPGCDTITFEADDGKTYCEVHHILPLSEGGIDRIENAICLCPTHHREAHFGKNRKALREVMLKIRATLVASW